MDGERVIDAVDSVETGPDSDIAGSTSPGDTKKLSMLTLLKQCVVVLAASFVYIPCGMIQMWNNVFATHMVESNATILGHEITVVPWQKDLVASITEMGAWLGT
ncbi:uncharacterized protein [Macrobrachium rosenbergii]|uniref:uncharacterized protein n=1 Tax=Macrobrachium rosenbergii TaxID=79674 RepID=UPI0034D62E74